VEVTGGGAGGPCGRCEATVSIIKIRNWDYLGEGAVTTSNNKLGDRKFLGAAGGRRLNHKRQQGSGRCRGVTCQRAIGS
jgi:hypothetical protein